jgi:hypothetical protein
MHADESAQIALNGTYPFGGGPKTLTEVPYINTKSFRSTVC